MSERPDNKAAHEVAGVEGITKSFGANDVLKDVSFSIGAGEVVALVGHNGAGKSTLAAIISGALAPDRGSVAIAGEPLSPRPAEALRLGVRCVYQHRTLVPSLSVAENVAAYDGTGMIRRRREEGELARRRLAALECGVDVHARVEELSAGEAQEVEIARGLDEHAKLLILDEPTASLSARESERLLRVTGSLVKSGIGQLLVSHDIDYVLEAADRVVVLREGRLVHDGPASELTRRDLLKVMLEGEFDEAEVRAPRPAPSGAPLLAFCGLTTETLQEVDAAVFRGEVLGFTGVLGSGVEDIARIATGQSRPISGQLMLDEEKIVLRSPRQALKHGIALVPGDRARLGLFPNLSIAHQIGLASMALERSFVLHRRREARVAAETAAAVQLPHNRLPLDPAQLSGGNQQKVIVGRVLDAKPSVLVAHEPTVGVDVGARAAIHQRIRAMASDGAAVIVASSDPEEVSIVCDRVLVLREGRIVLEAGPGEERRLVAAAMGEA